MLVEKPACSIDIQKRVSVLKDEQKKILGLFERSKHSITWIVATKAERKSEVGNSREANDGSKVSWRE